MISAPLRPAALPVRRLLEQLASPLDVDAYLSLLNPRWGTRLRGVVEQVVPITAEAASLTIRPGWSWTGHRAGQFVTVGVDVDGVRHHRCYSLTSPAGARSATIEITVQATEGGVVSNHLVHQTTPGDVLQLSQADGEFTLPDRAPDHGLLLVTGGSGITPVMGMLRTVARSTERPDVVVLHHATGPDRCLFLEELEGLDRHHDWLRVVTTFTRSSGETVAGSGTGRFGRDRLDALCADWRSREVYACGPEPLLDAVIEQCSGADAVGEVHTERFVRGALRRPTTATAEDSGVTRFIRSGLEVTNDGTTPLLEVAEQAGLAPASGCRMGICRTCTTRLEAGWVRDLRDGRVLESGQHVQVCVSSAVGDVALDL